MKLFIGFITYNRSTYRYLSFFLPSLDLAIDKARKTLNDLSIDFLVVDNSDYSFKDNINYLDKFFFKKNNKYQYKVWRSDVNIGFSRAYNLMINYSINEGGDLFLIINPDVLVDEYFIENLIKSYLKRPDVAIFSPKILYWDFDSKNKTDIIDSCGIGLSSFHRFFDLGQGKNIEEFLPKEDIFGFTGAGALMNLSRVKKVSFFNGSYFEIFDELMFMYKEDVDLSYRLRMNGEEIILVFDAIMYHDRTLSRVGFIKKIFIKKKNLSDARSFLNQLIILYKIKKIPFSCSIRLMTRLRLLLLFVYGLFFYREQLKNFNKIKPEIYRKSKKIIFSKENINKIEEFMHRY